MTAKPKGKKRSRTGLDIGTYSVKLVEISETADKPVLAAIGSKKMLEQSKDAAKDTIKLLIEQTNISTKEVNIAVSGQPVVVRLVSMPKMTVEELKGAIKFEAEKFIPFNINDCVIDFQIVKKYDKDNKLDILLAAVKKAYVEEMLDIVSSVGLSVGVVDVESFAIANAFLKNNPKDGGPDKTFAILNIGAGLTNLTLLRDGAVCLVRDMPVGSADFDASLSKALGMDIKKAEELKNAPGAKADEVTNCTRKVFNKLVDEMRLPFSYYENQFGRGVDEIVLSGGGAFLTGMSDMFQEAFGVKPMLLDPFKFLDTSSESIDKGLLGKAGSSFAVAVGLALR